MKFDKVFLVDDSVSGVGGTSLTLDAIIEPHKDIVKLISTVDFSLKDAFEEKVFFILGNLTHFSKNSLDAIVALMENKPFCKIEFDYGYCPYRGSIPHKILGKTDCNCPYGKDSQLHLREIYELIKNNSLHIFYMSEAQMRIHDKHLLGISPEKKSILSSCFTESTLLKFKTLKEKQKNNKYAIIDGNGGWHSEAKGVEKSIEYAKNNNLKFDLIKTKTHDEMLNLLSNYKGLITFPIIDDTCPRITLEARYMGLDIITNNFSQHITEIWWKGSDEKAINFTSSRPKFFWDKIKCLKY